LGDGRIGIGSSKWVPDLFKLQNSATFINALYRGRGTSMVHPTSVGLQPVD